MDTTNYYYHPNGNQTAKVPGRVTEGTGTEAEVSFAYFPSGLRASKTVDGTTTDFVLDGGQVVLELSGGSITAEYIRGINLICSTIGSATNYYLYNGRGDEGI